MDPDTLAAALQALERAASRNQLQRARYPDEPSQFVSSEVEVDEKIQGLHPLAASPELFPQFVELGGVQTLLGLLSHQNVDLSIAAVRLLAELTDSEVLIAESTAVDDADLLVRELTKCDLLKLLVENLHRLDEEEEEEQLGAFLTLRIIENLIEFQPVLAVSIASQTHILAFLLERLNAKTFDDNKHFAAEILSLLVQADDQNALQVGGRLQTFEGEMIDGLELLLLACSHYRKQDTSGAEEEECVENMYNALCAALMHEENRQRFFELEGPSLLARVLKERRFAAGAALRALDFSLQWHSGNALLFVEQGGLKVIFPPFMGRGLYKDKAAAGSGGQSADARRMAVEHSVGVVANLALALVQSPPSASPADGAVRPQAGSAQPSQRGLKKEAVERAPQESAASRLVKKFSEKNFEKLDRLCELFFRAEAELRLTDRRLTESGPDDQLEVEGARLAGGLGLMRHLSVIMGAIYVASASCRKQLLAKFHQMQRPLELVGDVLDDYVSMLSVANASMVQAGASEASRGAEKLQAWASVFG